MGKRPLPSQSFFLILGAFSILTFFSPKFLKEALAAAFNYGDSAREQNVHYTVKAFIFGKRYTSLSGLFSLYECNEQASFLQAKLHVGQAYSALSLGGAQRYFRGSCTFGYNLVLDYLLEDAQSRISVGADFCYRNLNVAGNLYVATGPWRLCTEGSTIQIRPASGADLYCRIRSNAYRNLSIIGAIEAYFGGNLEEFRYTSSVARLLSRAKLMVVYEPLSFIELGGGVRADLLSALLEPRIQVGLVFQGKISRASSQAAWFRGGSLVASFHPLGWIQRSEIIVQSYTTQGSSSHLSPYENERMHSFTASWIKPNQLVYAARQSVRTMTSKTIVSLAECERGILKEKEFKPFSQEWLSFYNRKNIFNIGETLQEGSAQILHAYASFLECAEVRSQGNMLDTYFGNLILYPTLENRLYIKAVEELHRSAFLEKANVINGTNFIFSKSTKSWFKLRRLSHLNYLNRVGMYDHSSERKAENYIKIYVDSASIENFNLLDVGSNSMRLLWKFKCKKSYERY